jgi:CHAD domain-containing protein
MDVADIKRAIAGHLRHALAALRGMEARSDESVHEARKALKRARTGLRLLRPFVEPALYENEDERLGNVARQLAGVREDKVQITTLGALIRKEKDPARKKLLAELRDEARRRRLAEWRAIRASGALEHIAGVLREASQRIERLHAAPDGEDLGDAVERLYRKGRRALKKSKNTRADETLHEARKRVKRVQHALEMLAPPAPPKKAGKLLKRLSAAGEYLGDDHDLALLEQALRRLGPGREALREAIVADLERLRGRLQKKARKRGKPAFRKKTRRLLGKLAA